MTSRRVDIRHVREHPGVTFEAVMAHYGLELLPSGSKPEQCKVLCPFHDDHKPSCGVNLKKKQFHCFPCGAGGNILDFVMQMEEIDARTGAIKLAEICEIETAPNSANTNRRPAKKLSPAERLRERHASAGTTESNSEKTPTQAKPAESTKKTPTPKKGARPAQEAAESASEDTSDFEPYTRKLDLLHDHPYLRERGIDPKLAEWLEIGYCARGFQRGRIAIRLHDAEGTPLGYAGRWAEKDPPEGQVRYLLPRNFPKHEVLYNFHRIMPEGEALVIVESFWSVFRLHQLGIPAVAPMGWALSPEQITLITRHDIKRVVLLLDGDKAGRDGVAAVLPELAKHLYVRAPEVPDGFKPHKADEALLRHLLG